MRGWRIFLTAAGAGLAARLTHLALIRGHPFHEMGESWGNSDMYQFIAWARHLAAGDWLDAQTFRPYFDWQRDIAPPEVWSSWFGAHVYYQPPLYPYLVGAGLAVTGSLDLVRVMQVTLGAINCGLLALLGARLFGRGAGLVAGLGAAIYGPFILYDAEVLRGTVVMSAQLLLLLALAPVDEAPRRGTRAGQAVGPALWRRMAGLPAGAAFGIAYLADPSILLFAPLAMLWLGWSSVRAAAGRAWRAPALFLAGAAIALLPLMARNVIVGAPLLSSTTRGPLAFVMGNAPDARPAGAFIPPSTGTILRRSGYRMLGTMSTTLSLYGGHYGPLVGKQWAKLKSLWGAYELPDNPSFYYAARVSPAVRLGLRFVPVAALGLVGLALTLPRATGDPRFALLPLYLVACMALFLLAHVVSRYRQPMVMALLPLAGFAVALWARAVRERRAAAAGVPAAALAVALILPWSPPAGYGYNRPAEFIMAARLYEKRGEMDRAIAELDTSVRLVREEPALHGSTPEVLFEKGALLARAGRLEEAAAALREVLEEDPRFPGAPEALSECLAALEGGGGATPRSPEPR